MNFTGLQIQKNITQKGMSIIEVLIGFALIGILSVAVTSLLTSQNKEMNSISQQFVVRELNSNLYQSFSDGDYCGCLLSGATLKTDGVAPAPKYSLNVVGHGKLPQIFSPSPACAELGGLYFPAAGELLPGNSSIKTATPNYNLANVQVVNPAPGPEDEFYADFQLLLDRSTLVRELRPPKKTIQIKINATAGSADSRPILSCSGVGAAPAGGGNALIAVHSQTTTVPNCPAGFDSLWTGYSYGGMTGDAGYHGGISDLSGIGSCVEDFRPMMTMECSSPTDCDFFTAGDYTIWMSTIDYDVGPANGIVNTVGWISRCRACRSTSFSAVFARHSLTATIPTCPNGATKLWDGYSLGGGTIGQSRSVLQADLKGPGSCLKEFYSIPFVECGGASSTTCDYFTPADFTYYLSINNTSTDEPPTSGIASIKPKVSRCSVCAF